MCVYVHVFLIRFVRVCLDVHVIAACLSVCSYLLVQREICSSREYHHSLLLGPADS